MHDFKVIDIENDSIYKYVDIVYNQKDSGKKNKISYIVREDIGYFSKRYNKWIIARKGFESDGATGAIDINSFTWIFHDVLCKFGFFEDESKCNNWQASSVARDILRIEKRFVRAFTWFIATWLMGGGEARKNAMF